MIRTPLRPLARVLKARAKGENPDNIEAENRAMRHEAMADKQRQRAEGRLLVLGLAFFCAFGVIGMRMGTLASSVPEEPRASAVGNPIIGQRSDIVDRNGRILATNLQTHSLYAHPRDMIDPAHAANGLAEIFPELDAAELLADFSGDRRFLWIRRQISPEQMQAVHDIGSPGLLFGPREMRLYPNGPVAAHILGGASYGREGVASAEVIGVGAIVEGTVRLKRELTVRGSGHERCRQQVRFDIAVVRQQAFGRGDLQRHVFREQVLIVSGHRRDVRIPLL